MDLKYPIGTFQYDGEMTSEIIAEWIREIEVLPTQFVTAVKNLNNEQLDTPYRDGGWTVRQVVHHVADSHMNTFIRFKLALTEENPTIKPYDETKWAELPDYELPIESSLLLLDSLHKRWVDVLKNLSTEDLKKTFHHPDSGEVALAKNIGIYAWHGKHHLAHITTLCERRGWI